MPQSFVTSMSVKLDCLSFMAQGRSSEGLCLHPYGPMAYS